MLIAVSADGRDLDSAVSASFETCACLLIVNMDNLELRAQENDGGAALAAYVASLDCEAVITGGLSPDTFEPIADAGITRYDGTGLSAREALARMEQNRLKLIRNPEKTDDCGHTHEESSCDCGHEDD